MPVNYQNSKIYKIEQINGEGRCYVGSTTKQYLSQRMDSHRSGYKGWKNGNQNFITSFQIFDDYGVENCQIILLESFSCNSKDELKAKEGEYIKSLDCVNKYIAGRTIKQYNEDNKGKLIENRKQYYEDNKEKIKQYNEDNKEKITGYRKQYYEDNKEKVKQYNEDNKEKITEYRKQFSENNPEYFKNYYHTSGLGDKIPCELCKRIVSKQKMQRHQKTNLCKKVLDVFNSI